MCCYLQYLPRYSVVLLAIKRIGVKIRSVNIISSLGVRLRSLKRIAVIQSKRHKGPFKGQNNNSMWKTNTETSYVIRVNIRSYCASVRDCVYKDRRH